MFVRIHFIPCSEFHTKWLYFCKMSRCVVQQLWYFYGHRAHFPWVMFKYHSLTKINVMFEIFILDNTWNVSENALLMISSLVFFFHVKWTPLHLAIYIRSKMNKQTIPILTAVPRHPNKWQQILQLLLPILTKSKCFNILF